MFLKTLPGNDRLYRYNEAAVLLFGGKRNVLSTAGHNGGYTENLSAAFNHRSGYNYCEHPEDAPMTYDEYMEDLVEHQLGLSLDTSVGMATIVSMENLCIEEASYKGLTVSAIATASLEVNGGRVCDPAQYYEEKGISVKIKPGTINIMLHVNANMSPGCMTRAVVTLTEAKTAAIQELMGSSLYSSGIATGSGSDNVIIISDAESDFQVTYAGKHGKLGEMIGTTVKTAVKKALGKHMDLTPETQHSMEKRTFRYGLTKERYWDVYAGHSSKTNIYKAEFADRLDKLDRDGRMVALTSLYVHLLDQTEWGLLTQGDAQDTARVILNEMAEYIGMDFEWEWLSSPMNTPAHRGMSPLSGDRPANSLPVQQMCWWFATFMAAAGAYHGTE